MSCRESMKNGSGSRVTARCRRKNTLPRVRVAGHSPPYIAARRMRVIEIMQPQPVRRQPPVERCERRAGHVRYIAQYWKSLTRLRRGELFDRQPERSHQRQKLARLLPQRRIVHPKITALSE